MGAHIVAFLLSGEALTEEKPFVLHKCHTPLCVNPFHLKAGDQLDNMADMIEAGRSRTGDRHHSRTKPERVVRGSKIGNSKLDEEKVREIRRIYEAGGVKQCSLAPIYEVSQALISLILRRKSWGWLPD